MTLAPPLRADESGRPRRMAFNMHSQYPGPAAFAMVRPPSEHPLKVPETEVLPRISASANCRMVAAVSVSSDSHSSLSLTFLRQKRILRGGPRALSEYAATHNGRWARWSYPWFSSHRGLEE